MSSLAGPHQGRAVTGKREGRRTRLIAQAWRIFAVCCLLAGLGSVEAGHRALAAQPGALVGVAIKGDVYVAQADGSVNRRLTTYGLNSQPALSPHQRLVAYLSVPSGFGSRAAGGSAHNVWLATTDGSTAYRIADLDPHHDRSGLTWSPDGRYLAYFQGVDLLVYDSTASTTQTVMRQVHRAGSTTSPIAWAPDSKRIAVQQEPQSDTISRFSIVVAVATLGKGRVTYSRIEFPPKMMAVSPGDITSPGSFASADGLAWTADGQRLLLSTSGRGEGQFITGIWQVAAKGGTASLLLGTPSAVLERSATSGPLKGATHFELSPDGLHLATDPEMGSGRARDDRLWVGDAKGHGGRYLDLHLSSHPNCVLVQYSWLVTGTGLAYVVTCVGSFTGAGSDITSYLFSVGIGGTNVAQLAEVADPHQYDLQISRSMRCVQCGG